MSERIEVTTYFLEMPKLPSNGPLPTPKGAVIERGKALRPADYRELYLDVGARWLWYERSEMDDAELSRLLDHDDVSIHVLTLGGQVAGYTELRNSPALKHTHTPAHDVQILYFGLKHDYIGLGLGRFFLDWTIRQTFTGDVRRLWVHTCSLDHPRALATYERAGFREYKRDSGWVRIPQSALDRQARILRGT